MERKQLSKGSKVPRFQSSWVPSVTELSLSEVEVKSKCQMEPRNFGTRNPGTLMFFSYARFNTGLLSSTRSRQRARLHYWKFKSALFILAIPMVIEMFMESLFALVDIFFVSQVSVDAVTTIGLTEAILTLIYSVAIGCSSGATALVARRIGEKKTRGGFLYGFPSFDGWSSFWGSNRDSGRHFR